MVVVLPSFVWVARSSARRVADLDPIIAVAHGALIRPKLQRKSVSIRTPVLIDEPEIIKTFGKRVRPKSLLKTRIIERGRPCQHPFKVHADKAYDLRRCGRTLCR